MIKVPEHSEEEQISSVLREMDLLEKLLQEARDAVNRVAHKSQQIRRTIQRLKNPESIGNDILIR
jgi:prefoldin subunit 5